VKHCSAACGALANAQLQKPRQRPTLPCYSFPPFSSPLLYFAPCPLLLLSFFNPFSRPSSSPNSSPSPRYMCVLSTVGRWMYPRATWPCDTSSPTFGPDPRGGGRQTPPKPKYIFPVSGCQLQDIDAPPGFIFSTAQSPGHRYHIRAEAEDDKVCRHITVPAQALLRQVQSCTVVLYPITPDMTPTPCPGGGHSSWSL